MKSAKLIYSTVLTLTCTLGGYPTAVLAQTPYPPGGVQTNDLVKQPSASPEGIQTTDPLKPDDRIRLTVVGFADLSGEYTIAGDGTLQLPLVGSVTIVGLTPAQAVNRITQALLPYVRRPQVGLAILKRSPIRISVTGEVVQPGPRLISQTDNQPGSRVSSETEANLPITLSRALFVAGGIKPDADLRNVLIRRTVPENSAAGKSITSRRTELKVDLWQVIQSGDLASDLRIYDGDEIVVPTAQITNPNQQMLLASTVAPAQVIVQVTGEVRNPKQIEIRPTAGVTEAVAAAGGFTENARKDTILLVRMLPDGRITNRTFAFGKESDPLMNGDVIVVNKSQRGAVGSVFDFLGRLINPLGPIFRLFERTRN